MPELPEVETVCRLLHKNLVGYPIASAEVEPDALVMSGHQPQEIHAALVGRIPKGVGRRGKFFWLEFEDHPIIYAHLGMAGWVRELPGPDGLPESAFRLREHGNAPLTDDSGRLKFQKLAIRSSSEGGVALTDGRRFARVWLGPDPTEDPRVRELGRDAWLEPYGDSELLQILQRRSAPMKAVLLDQKLFAGVGNWIADEALYQARILPARAGNSLSKTECQRLLASLKLILDLAVEVGAQSSRYPEDWLFHVRWDGTRGHEVIAGRPIVRETIGGRTTAYVPGIQK